MSLAKKAVQGGLYLTINYFVLFVLGFVSNIILARLLSPEHYGIFALGLFFFDVVQRIRLFGFKSALIHKKEPSPEEISTHFLLHLIFSAVVILLCLLVSPLISIKYDRAIVEVFLVLALICLFDNEGLGATPSALLEKELRYREFSLINFFAFFLSAFAAIVSALAGMGVWSLVIQRATFNLVLFIGCWLVSPWKLSLRKIRLNRGAATWFLREQGVYLWVVGLMGYVVLSFDDFLVGTLVGVTALGFYSMAYNISKMPLGFLSNFIQVAFPTYSKLQDDKEKLSFAYDLTNGFLVRFGFVASIMLLFVAREAVILLLGEKWLPSVILIQLLVLYSLMRPLQDAMGSVSIALGKVKEYSHLSILQGILMFTLTPVMVYFYQARGAAISVGLIVLFGVVLLQRSLRERIEINNFRIYLYPGVAALVSSLAYLGIFLNYEFTFNLWFVLFLKIGLLLLVYSSVLFLLEGKVLIGRFRYLLSVVYGK
ncbi:hypothetical protein HKBW3S42_00942 [Candidatus Hakubella thermalkaliphila]|uniref:Uncharacterized protein n=1 Tax=Candidatus Hakubella thermalkaliphila TaxID=2754717 RepID=A0A6V8PNI8_9ACTN|nr:hypothetical protein HKBW3S42_00942 [Candidatus Hakubella thermalkaliphila]